MTTFGIQLEGHQDIMIRLDRLGKKAAVAIRPAINKAMTPVNKMAKRLVVRETGALWKSIGKKSKTYRGEVVWVGVGARKGFTKVGPDGRLRQPQNYSHLIEFGRRRRGAGLRSSAGRAGKAGGLLSARPFLGPALKRNRGKIMGILNDEIPKGIDKQVLKLAARG